jgi:signal transduction histidine kinase
LIRAGSSLDMKLVITLNFAILAVIMVGLFAIARNNYRLLDQSSKYWSIAIICDAVGLVMLGVLFLTVPDFNKPNISGTFANTLLFASTIYQAISIRALNTRIAKQTERYVFAGVLLFAVIWDFTRLNTDTNTRIMLFAVYVFFSLLWQLQELNKNVNTASSQIKIIRFSVKGELVFTVIRFCAVAVVSIEIAHVEELPLVGLFSLWILYALKIVVYAGLLAYWTEDLAKQKTKVELEKQQFKALSEAQEQLIADLGRLNKAATTGVMAASIAHELSQPLQSLVLNIDSSQKEAKAANPDWEFMLELLHEQSSSVNKMIEVIGAMRGVFAEGAAADEQVNLFELVKKLAVFIDSQSHKRGVQVEYFNHGHPLICVRPAEIQQAILNLVANGFDALDAETSTVKKLRISVQQVDEQVFCRIEDNGSGIPEHRQDQIFKFLKTTKSTGMGLGLWLTKYIVEKNHGQISLGQSELGGAMFTIQLPVAKTSPSLANAS